MKELEKTKRISIAAVIAILAVIVALLTYKKPKNVYTLSPQQALESVKDNSYVNLEDLNAESMALVDIRNNYEFEKGHIANAVNVDASTILSEESKDLFNKLTENNKTILLYGADPIEAITPMMLLKQLGYDNVKILAVQNYLEQESLKTVPFEVEKQGENINQFIDKTSKKIDSMLKAKPKPKPQPKPAPKIIVPKKKKKKLPVEGGC